MRWTAAVIAAGVVAGAAWFPGEAVAFAGGKPVVAFCGSQTVDQPYQYDNVTHAYWAGDQQFVDDAWSRFSMSDNFWDRTDMGYPNADDLSRPLGRTLDGLAVLAYGATLTPSCNSWANAWSAYCWAGNAIDELVASCENKSPAGEAAAYTAFGPVIDNYTEVYPYFYFTSNAVDRAGTIAHEAQHAQAWCGHEGSCRGGACDKNWNHGCTGTLAADGPGANAAAVTFLVTLGWSRGPGWSTSAMREYAIDAAWGLLDDRFALTPCWRPTHDGSWTTRDPRDTRTCGNG